MQLFWSVDIVYSFASFVFMLGVVGLNMTLIATVGPNFENLTNRVVPLPKGPRQANGCQRHHEG